MESTVAISSDFLEAYSRLPRKIQQKTTALIAKMRANLDANGINYEKINSCDGKLRSVRVDDEYRGIVARQKGTGVCLLLWVDHHDEAYEWASRKKCVVNATTGAIQVYEVVERADLVVAKPEAPSLFADLSDRELKALGVPGECIDLVRSVEDLSSFERACSKLPAECVEGLSWIVNGFPFDEVVDLIASGVDEKPADEDDLSGALGNPGTCRTFVVVEGETELRELLNAPLEKWRTFLHPSQRKLVGRSFNGPARVLGSAGTGKTVVAMHRARHLAGKCSGDERVLFTTFSSNLAADIQANLKKICSNTEFRNIDVQNLDAWVASFLKRCGFTYSIEYDDGKLRGIWEDAIAEAGGDLPFEPSFYADEWGQVALAQEELSLASYAHANRAGRGVRLGRKERMAVWKVMEAYQRISKDRGVRDVDFAMYEAAVVLRQKGNERRYRYVLVDEGQDFSSVAYRLVRALAGDEKPDDIFIVGDARQRIYGRTAVLSRCGINIRGRASVLRINYRTTQETHHRATAVLEGIPFDDFDGLEEVDNLAQSLFHGVEPAIEPCRDGNAEVKHIVSKIKDLIAAGVSDKDICVAMRTNSSLDSYATAFADAGLRVYKLKARKADDRGIDGVRFATMHRVKGLEFDYVFVADVTEGAMPARFAIKRARSEGNLEQLMRAERSLLYVAMTRAKKQVFVTSAGEMAEIVGVK